MTPERWEAFSEAVKEGLTHSTFGEDLVANNPTCTMHCMRFLFGPSRSFHPDAKSWCTPELLDSRFVVLRAETEQSHATTLTEVSGPVPMTARQAATDGITAAQHRNWLEFAGSLSCTSHRPSHPCYWLCSSRAEDHYSEGRERQ